MHRYVTATIALLALLAAATSGLAFANSRQRVAAAPKVVRVQYGGKPKHVGYTLLERYIVPQGYCLHVTHTTALVEKHSPPHNSASIDAGEFTVTVGDIAQSSLESNNGIAFQGEGERDVTMLPGQNVDLGVWLRDGKNPELYYYSISMIGTKYRCHT